MRPLLLLYLLLCGLPLPACAESAVSCHCFQDRVYDPARPTAADDYFLATLHNNLYAAVTGVSKKEVVRSKMSGGDGAAMWVNWYLANRGGVDVAMIEAERRNGLDWRGLAEKHRLPLDRLAPEFTRALLRGDTTAQLAARVVDEVLLTRMKVDGGELAALRRAGADDRQCVAALVAGLISRRPARHILATVQQGGVSWSGVLAEIGIDAGNAESRVRGLLR